MNLEEEAQRFLMDVSDDECRIDAQAVYTQRKLVELLERVRDASADATRWLQS